MGEAVALSERLEQTQELSQALGLQTLVKFVAGQGLDESNLRRAVQLEDRRPQMLVALRPTLQNALLLACTGRLEEARLTMLSTRRECRERGDEAEASSPPPTAF
ncbi:MAG: hypothetical protein ACSLE6_00865 [Mycobacterium sp.]